MLEQQRVETTLELIDRVSPKLDRLLEKMTRLESRIGMADERLRRFGSGNRITALNAQIRRLNEQLARTTELAGSASASVRGVGAGGEAAAAGNAARRAERSPVAAPVPMRSGAGMARYTRTNWRYGSGEADAGAGTAPPFNFRGGGRGGGGARVGRRAARTAENDLHIHGYAPVGPFGHARVSMTPHMLGAGVLGFGTYQNVQLQRVLDLTMGAAEKMPNNMKPTALHHKLRSDIMQMSSQTGMSPIEAAHIALRSFKMMAGFKTKQRLSILPEVGRFAYMEHQYNNVAIPEAGQALLGLLHQFQIYNPKRIKKLSGAMLGLSLSTPLNMKQSEQALSYVVPTTKAMDNVDPFQMAAMATVMQRMGITRTKSGTWEAAFFRRLFPKTSLAGQLTGYSSKSNIFGSAGSTQMKGLRALGLYTKSGHPTFMEGGHLHPMQIFQAIHDHLSKMSISQRNTALHQAFGTRGQRFGAIASSDVFMKQYPEIKRMMERFEHSHQLSKFYNSSAYQQYKVMFSRLDITLMQLTDSIMYTLSPAIKRLDEVLQHFNHWAGGHKKMAGEIGGAASMFFGGRLLQGLMSRFGGAAGGEAADLLGGGLDFGGVALAGLGLGYGLDHTPLVGKGFRAAGNWVGGEAYSVAHSGFVSDLTNAFVAAMREVGLDKPQTVHVKGDGRGKMHRASHPTATSGHTGAHFAQPPGQ